MKFETPLKEEVGDVAEKLRLIVNKKSFDEIFTKEGMSFYIYYTGCDVSSNGDKPFDFLSCIRPPVFGSNGTNIISRSDMIEIGFKVEILYESTLKF